MNNIFDFSEVFHTYLMRFLGYRKKLYFKSTDKKPLKWKLISDNISRATPSSNDRSAGQGSVNQN